MNSTDFHNSINYGKTGEDIFKEDFLEFMEIHYENVTNCQQFQVIDTDFKTKIGTYEIKLSYKDNQKLVIEDYTNNNPDLGPKSYGWFFKSKADLIVFISKKTHTMIFIPWTKGFKEHYLAIRDRFRLIPNKWSTRQDNGDVWQSAFRVVPLDAITGYYSIYKKIHKVQGELF